MARVDTLAAHGLAVTTDAVYRRRALAEEKFENYIGEIAKSALRFCGS